VAVKIKLKRIGKIREPHYRIVIADARAKRNGRAIEEIGQYHPLHDPSVIKVDSERVQYWLGVGAQPTEAVAALLRVTGDWQKFKGEPAPPPMKMAEPKQDKRAVFEAAVKDGAAEPTAAATTPKKSKAPKAAKAEPAEAGSEPAAEPVAKETAPEAAPAVAEPPAEASSEPDAEAQAAPDPAADTAADPSPDDAGADEGKA
jgi:small subunit ribosomal protein S16